MNAILQYFDTNALRKVILIALFVRVIASFTSPGYLMVDDHFLVVEAGASWADGEDYNNWLPWNQTGEAKPHAANFAYVGTQYVVFAFLKTVGVDDPQVKMIIIRLLHGLYSLLIVYFAFLITRRLSNERYAVMVGLLLALGAIMPNFSVRQLVEFICIPPMLYASWVLVKHQDQLNWKHFLLAGIGVGLATGFRFQCGVFGVGLGLALLLKREFVGAVLLGFSSLLVFSLAQIQDVFIWGEPFTQLRAYVDYNESHSGSYPNGPWYMYLLTLAGYMVPPLSLFLLFGFFKGTRKYLLIVVPALAFLVFHSFFPNKQERFIFPIIPYITIVGVMVWGDTLKQSNFWMKHHRLWKGFLIAFLTLNTLGLLVLTTAYGKRSRVESMYYLYKAPDYRNFNAVFLDSDPMPPLFYTGSWESNYWFKPGETDIESQLNDICRLEGIREIPNYLLFFGNRNLDEHTALFDEYYGGIDYETTIQPGFLDRVLHYLNPRNNTLEVVHIYRCRPCASARLGRNETTLR